MGAEFCNRNTPSVQAFKGLDLTRFQAGEIAEYFFDSDTPVLQPDNVVATVNVMDFTAHATGHITA